MLLDGRNRREAAKLAGIIPPVIVTAVDPKLAVHRSNNQNRDATPGQKAMATAMAFPEAKRGGDRKTDVFKSLQNDLNQSERNAISRARYVLRNNPIPDGEHYPQRCLAIMAGTLSLTEAYDLTQADAKKREEEEAIRQANAALATLQGAHGQRSLSSNPHGGRHPSRAVGTPESHRLARRDDSGARDYFPAAFLNSPKARLSPGFRTAKFKIISLIMNVCSVICSNIFCLLYYPEVPNLRI